MAIIYRLDNIMFTFPDNVSVILLDSAGAIRLSHQAELIHSSASLIKVPLAWQLLESDLIEQRYTIQASDICDPDGSLAVLVGSHLGFTELAQRMIAESENNATNIILHALGGIPAANQWLDQHHWQAIRWRRHMLDFAARNAGLDNTTSAQAIAQILWQFNHTRQQNQHFQALYDWMRDSISDDKIRAGLEPSIEVAHKVGDLPDAEHDAAIINLPDGRWFVLVILVSGVPDVEQTRAQIASIARQLITHVTQKSVY